MGDGWRKLQREDCQIVRRRFATLERQRLDPLGSIDAPILPGFGEALPQDLRFTYTGPDGENRLGQVVYTGEPSQINTLLVTVDRATGEVSILNPTVFSQEIESYTVSSEAGSLNVAGWNSLDEQGIEGGDWLAPAGDAFRVVELQEDGTTTFDAATPYSLGELFTLQSAEELVFEFLLAGESELSRGVVEYIFAGDYNDDGRVNAVD